MANELLYLVPKPKLHTHTHSEIVHRHHIMNVDDSSNKNEALPDFKSMMVLSPQDSLTHGVPQINAKFDCLYSSSYCA
jgi:hypothetical protein